MSPIITITLILFVSIPNTQGFNNFNNTACHKWSYYWTLNFHIPSKHCYPDPAIATNFDVPNLIRLLDFVPENHTITTPDGYIITFFRILSSSGQVNQGQPAFLMHGILMDTSAFLYTQRRSLAYNLTHAGYDVWLGSARSSRYGRRHLNMTDSEPNFWNFSLDEMVIDLRSTLQYIGKVTGRSGEIVYIGHSMGTSLAFMYLSEFNNDNLLKGVLALAPVVYIEDTLFASLVKALPVAFLQKILKAFGVTSLFRNYNLYHRLLKGLCTPFPHFCYILFFESFAGASDLFIPEFLTEFLTAWPDAASVNQLFHFTQITRMHRFAKFDYGARKNKKLYGTETNPTYDLGRIRAPVYMFYGATDGFVSKRAIDEIYKELGSADKAWTKIPVDNDKKRDQFGHLQMIQTIKEKQLLYNVLHEYLGKLIM